MIISIVSLYFKIDNWKSRLVNNPITKLLWIKILVVTIISSSHDSILMFSSFQAKYFFPFFSITFVFFFRNFLK